MTDSIPRRLAALALSFALSAIAAATAHAQPASLSLPNWVEISPRLVTSGQPSAEALAGLAAQGFEAVVYLAPPTVGDAVRDEAAIVAKQGLTFIHIPIPFGNPTDKHFEDVVAVLQALKDRKLLVHCQVNMLASTMVFLYRSIALREDPREAYKSVSRIWTPEGPWRQLMERQLRKNGIAFEIF